MGQKKITKRNVLRMSLGSNKNPMNISLGGYDKNVEISFNSKNNKNIPIPTSTITGRRIRQCCLYKYPKNEIMLTFPENIKFLPPNNGLPLVIEAEYLQNFKAAFYPLQLTDNVTESMEETLSSSRGDYPEKFRDKKQYPSFEEYDTSNNEEKKKRKKIMKHIHTLKRSLGQIGETLKEIEKCQTEMLCEEMQSNRYHDRVSDKNKIKRFVENGELIASRKYDKLPMPSKSGKHTEDKVLDNARIKEQTKHEEKLRRKENQMDTHFIREVDFASSGKTAAESADNMKSLELMLNNILKQNQIIRDTSTENALQRNRKADTLPEDNKLLDHKTTKRQFKQEEKAQEKEHVIDNHREDDFASAGKTMAKLADNMKSTKLMLDDILRREKSMSEYKKKYIQDVEALYEDQQRLLEGSCNIFDRSDRVSSEESDLEQRSADQQQECKKKNDKASEFKSNLQESGKEDANKYESNSNPDLTDIKKKQKLEEKLENIIKEIQLLRFVNHIFEARKAKTDTIQKARQSQEKTTETSEVDIAIDKGTSTNIDSSVREVTGTITHKYNILKGGQCAGNIYETTLTQTVKEFPSKTDESKYAKLSKKEYFEALSDAKNAMRKLEATFDKLIPVLPKIIQQPGVDPDASIKVSHHEENISGKILREQKIEPSNGLEKLAKDRPRRDQKHISSKDEEIAARDKYISVQRVQEDRECAREKVAKDRPRRDIEAHISNKDEEIPSKDQDGQEDRKQEQTKSEEPRLVVSPGKAISEEHISSEKSNGLIPEEVESQSLQKGFDSSKTKISPRTGAIPKLPIFRSEEKLSSKGSMRFETLDETILRGERESVKSQKILEQPHKAEELIISPSSIRRTDKRTYEKKYFIQDIDDRPKPFQTHHSSMKGSLKPTIIKQDHESAQRVQVSSDPINFGRIVDYLDLFFFGRPDEEKLTHLQAKSTLTKPHATDKSVSDSILSNLFKAADESEQLPKEHAKLKRDITEETTSNKYKLEPLERSYSRKSSKLRSDMIEEGSMTSISEYELEFPKAEDRRKLKGHKKLIRSDAFEEGIITSISPKVEGLRKLKEDKEVRSDIIEEGTITSISQYELESPTAEDHLKPKEDNNLRSDSDAIIEGTITSISQYELESPIAEDRRKLKEDNKVRSDSDAIIEGTITSISQYELESPIVEDRRKFKEDKKVRSDSDVIKEGTITSISQYELESPKAEEQRKLKEDKKVRSDSDVTEEGTITSISQYELESPIAEDRRKLKEYKKVRSDSDVIEEGTITSISQYELESPTEDRRKLTEDKKLRSDSDVIKGTITSISQYELESPKAEEHRKHKRNKKLIRSDAIEEGTISMSPKIDDHRKKEDKKLKSDVIEEGNITSISQYELEYPKEEDHQKLTGDKKYRSDITKDRTISSISQYELEKLQEPYRRFSDERTGRNSNEHSRRWYVPEYVEYSVSEPDTEVFGSIEDIVKLRDVQQGRTSSKDKSRSWYVPEYFDYSGSEPETEVSGSVEDISKLKDAEPGRTSSKDKSRSWYVPEYVEYPVSEPDTEVSGPIEDIAKLRDVQRGRTSSKGKSRRWYVPEYVEYSVSEPDTEVSSPIEDIAKLRDIQRGRTSSKDKSRSWYVPKYFEYSGSEPETEVSGSIEDTSKLKDAQPGRTSSKYKSRRWYVPEYVEYSVSEPDTEEFNKIEEGYISDISQDKLNNSERGYTFLKEKSRNWYVPEKYLGSTLNEPSGKEFDNIKKRNKPDISNYEIERVRASDLSNYNRRRSHPIYEDHHSPTSQHLRGLNTYEGFTLRENNTLKTPNIPLKYQSTTYTESQREKIPKSVSADFSLNKQNSRDFSLLCTSNDENLKITCTKTRGKAMASPDVVSKARKKNVLDEMPYRGLSHSNESMNRSDVFLPDQEFSRKSYDRTFRRPLPELQDYHEFGSLENAGPQSSRSIKKDIDRKDI